MANLKDITASAKAGKTSSLKDLETMTAYRFGDDFTGIMDGPEMMGLEYESTINGGEMLLRDQHAKRIGDLP